jgi:hypothetical protein
MMSMAMPWEMSNSSTLVGGVKRDSMIWLNVLSWRTASLAGA